MNRTELRKVLTDRVFLMAVLGYSALAGLNYTVSLSAGLTWTAINLVLIVAVGVIVFDANRRRAAFRADLDRERQEYSDRQATRRHEFDLRMERLAQEADILSAGGPAADQIRARWAEESKAREAEERTARQARIAEHEARQLGL